MYVYRDDRYCTDDNLDSLSHVRDGWHSQISASEPCSSSRDIRIHTCAAAHPSLEDPEEPLWRIHWPGVVVGGGVDVVEEVVD